MENKTRKPWIAGLLSLIQPGLGHVYNGEIRKALIIYPLPLLIIPGLIICLNNRFILYFLFFYAILGAAYYLIVLVDSIKIAKRFNNEFTPKKYNKLIVYIGIYLLVTIIALSVQAFVKHNIIQAFKFPSGSMEPTFLVGDHILVDRRQESRIPQRGDLIVFEYPVDPAKDFLKRVVAIGGDTVEIKNKQLLVNGKVIKEAYIVHKDAGIIPASQNPRDQFGPQVVPADSYFVLGDNRDQSYDSRFWGTVAKNKIKGTVKAIYWSWDRNKSSVRWDRIGRRKS